MNKQLAFAGLTVKAYDDEKREFSGIATTPSPDKVRDVVDPLGAVFTLPIPLLAGHKHDKPIGEVYEARVTRSGIEYKARIPKVTEDGDFKDRVDLAWQEIKYGVVKGVSIGFAGLDYEMLPTGGLHFKKWRWDELSTVAIPASAEATIAQIKSAYAAEDTSAAASGNTAGSEAATATLARAVSTKTVVKLAQAKGNKMKLSESLKGYQDALAAKQAERLATVKKSLDEGRTADEAELETINTLNAEIKALEAQIDMVKGLVDADVASATPAAGAAERKSVATTAAVPINHNRAEKGLAMAQLVRLQFQSKGIPHIAVQIAESQKQSLDPRVVDMTKAAVSAAATTVPSWAGNLATPGGIYGDFVEFLRPLTILGRFGNGGIPSLRTVPFGVPLLGQTSGGQGYWVGEGKAKPLTKFDTETKKLEPLKVANIAVITNEMLLRASIAADTWIRDELVRALIARMDTDFVNPAKTAVAGVSPASITNGVTPIVSSGNDAAAIRADVSSVLDAYADANNDLTAGVWIFGAKIAQRLSMMQTPLGQGKEFPGLTMRGGEFEGFPAIVSNYVPAETVVFLNANDVYFGDEGGFDVKMSGEASLEMLDDPVGDSVTPTGAASMVSMFQTNSTAFLAERHLNWMKRRAFAVQLLTQVKWGQP